LPYLDREGIHFERYEIPKSPFRRYLLFRKARLFSMVFLQKRLFSPFWFKVLRRNSKVLVFEFDDAIFLDRMTQKLSKMRNRRFQRTISACDACITTNNYLATYARKYSNNVKILPNAVDLGRWKIKPRRSSVSLTIGFMGSASTAQYLMPLREKFSNLCEMYPQITFKVISDQPVQMEGVRMQYQPFNENTEVEDVHTFDIAIAPYPEDGWTMGKFPVKILSYMACGLPVVSSDVTCVRRIVKDRENGLLAVDPEDWERKLALLIEAPGFQEILGDNARRTIENIYSLEKVARGYVSVFKSLVS
jgi:glycosyltransferase involved in cell wall biosynthesis